MKRVREVKRNVYKDSMTVQFDNLANTPLWGIRWPAPGGPQGPMNSIVQGVSHAIEQLDAATGEARRNEALSEIGRVARVKPLRDAANQAVVKGLARIDKEDTRIANAWQTLYAVPELASGDAAGAALDAEIRQRVGMLTDVLLERLHADLRIGKQNRIAEALMRDPFDGVEREFARSLWREQIEKHSKRKSPHSRPPRRPANGHAAPSRVCRSSWIAAIRWDSRRLTVTA